MKKTILSFVVLCCGALCGEVVQITQSNFDLVKQAKLPFILDLNAKWCGPCKMMGKVFDEVSEEYKGKVLFGKVDVDSQSQIADLYGVTGLPTLVYLKPGREKPVMVTTGYQDKEQFKETIHQFLKGR